MLELSRTRRAREMKRHTLDAFPLVEAGDLRASMLNEAEVPCIGLGLIIVNRLVPLMTV